MILWLGRGLFYMSVLQIDVRGIARPEAAMVDALARLYVALKRAGFELRICGASDQLCELIAFMGLADVLLVEVGRQPE